MKNVVFAFLACLLVLASAEAVLRIAGTVRGDLHPPKSAAPASLGAWSLYSPDLGWERRPGYKGADLDGIPREFDSQGYFAIDSKKLSDNARKKVIFIGDAPFGIGVAPAAAYPEVVETLVPDIDAINLGVAGYSSYQGLEALRKYLPLLKPAVIVATFNANDRREIYPDELPDGAGRFRSYRPPAALFKKPAPWESLRTWRVLHGLLRRAGLMKETLVKPFRIDALRPRVNEREYRENLSAMAALARQNGIPLIFVLLHDNPLQSGYVSRGVASLEASRYEDAIQYVLETAVGGGSFERLARIYLARAYAAKGDEKSASRYFYSGERRDSIQGGLPVRLDSVYNDIMRQAGRENGVEVVDAAAALDRSPYMYEDALHFNASGHRAVAEAIAPKLAEALKKTPAAVLAQVR